MNRFKVAYEVTNRDGKRKSMVRKVEADVTKLDKQGLNALTDVLSISHGKRQDENKSAEMPDPDVEITAVRGVSRAVVDLEYPLVQKTPVVSGKPEETSIQATAPVATPKKEQPVGQAAGKKDKTK